MRYTIDKYTIKPTQSLTIRSQENYIIISVEKDVMGTLNQTGFYLKPSDYIYLKPHQSVLLYAGDFQKELVIYVQSLSTAMLAELSDESCNLIEKLEFFPDNCAIVRGSNDQSLLIKNMMNKLYRMDEDEIQLGKELYVKSLIASIVVVFLRECVRHDTIRRQKQSKKLEVDDIFKYISSHIQEDLSLDQLENHFYISKEHISRVFKHNTGMSLHSYIIKKRIDLAKEYLLKGQSVYSVYSLAGFGSYNHFFKAFKKETGMTPKQYCKQYK